MLNKTYSLLACFMAALTGVDALFHIPFYSTSAVGIIFALLAIANKE